MPNLKNAAAQSVQHTNTAWTSGSQLGHMLLILCSFLVVAMAGCNADPGSRREIQMLRAEILELEDEYYALKSRCGEADDRVGSRRSRIRNSLNRDESQYYCEDCRQYFPSSNHSELHYAPGNYDIPLNEPVLDTGTGDRTLRTPLQAEPPIQQKAEPEEIDLQIETFDQPDSSSRSRTPSNFSERTRRDQQSAQRPTPPDELSMTIDALTDSTSLASVSADKIEFVVKAINRDADPAPDGLWLALPIPNDLGNAPLPVKIQISAMNPELPNGQQRIGFWTFEQNRIAGLVKETETTREIRIFVPWQIHPLPGSELIVFVRSYDDSGKAREGSGFVEIESVPKESGDLVAAGTDSFDGSRVETPSGNPTMPGATSRPQGSSWRPLR